MTDWYITSKWNTEYMVTRYVSERLPQEYFCNKDKLLGPVINPDENDEDYIFELEGIDGIFVSSKRETFLFDY